MNQFDVPDNPARTAPPGHFPHEREKSPHKRLSGKRPSRTKADNAETAETRIFDRLFLPVDVDSMPHTSFHWPLLVEESIAGKVTVQFMAALQKRVAAAHGTDATTDLFHVGDDTFRVTAHKVDESAHLVVTPGRKSLRA